MTLQPGRWPGAADSAPSLSPALLALSSWAAASMADIGPGSDPCPSWSAVPYYKAARRHSRPAFVGYQPLHRCTARREPPLACGSRRAHYQQQLLSWLASSRVLRPSEAIIPHTARHWHAKASGTIGLVGLRVVWRAPGSCSAAAVLLHSCSRPPACRHESKALQLSISSCVPQRLAMTSKASQEACIQPPPRHSLGDKHRATAHLAASSLPLPLPPFFADSLDVRQGLPELLLSRCTAAGPVPGRPAALPCWRWRGPCATAGLLIPCPARRAAQGRCSGHRLVQRGHISPGGLRRLLDLIKHGRLTTR